MGLFEIIASLLTLSAFFSFINYKLIKLPNTIGLMLISLVFSLGLIAADQLLPEVNLQAKELLNAIDFNETLLHGMLGFLLFAGAMHVDLSSLRSQYRVIGALATVGVLTSTFLVAVLFWGVASLFGFQLPFIYALLFGALISPTDPIAVMGVLKKLGVPESLETKIVGESLFNDGVGVVIFLVILQMATGKQELSGADVGLLFVQEAAGGVIFGFCAGVVTNWLLKQVDNYQVEILLTLALVTGGYALAEHLHFSAPIAIVVAGLLIGNHGRSFAMSEETRERLDSFWELIDEILNAVLFLLIGLEIIVISMNWDQLLIGCIAIPLILASRMISVSIPVNLLKLFRFRTFTPHVIKVLTWGGLRGGISVALALSLPPSETRDLILAVTYVVVVFSILGQGLTIGPLLRRLLP